MKVRNPPGNITGTVKNKTASSVSKSEISWTKSSPGSAKPRKEGPVTARHLLLWKNIDSIINRLDRKNRIHLTLIPLLNLIKELPAGPDGLPLNTQDKHLLLKILDAWKGLNGHSLAEKSKVEVERLERILENDGGTRYLFVQKPLYKSPEISLRVEDVPSESKEDLNLSRLDMRLNLNRLGRFQILIEQKDKIRICSIYGEQPQSCREVKKARKTLLERIINRGLSLTSLKIRKKPLPSEEQDSQIQKGIQLWG